MGLSSSVPVETTSQIETNLAQMIASGTGNFIHDGIEILERGNVTFTGDSQSQIAMMVGKIQQEMGKQGVDLVNLYVGNNATNLAKAPFQVREGLNMQQLLVSFMTRCNLARALKS